MLFNISLCFATLPVTFTIGPSGDFKTISSGLDFIRTSPQNRPVEFLIFPGIYSESLEIEQLSWVFLSNPVTFLSESGNPADVILEGVGSLPVLTLSCSNLNFINLTFRGSADSLIVIGKADYAKFENCRFELKPGQSGVISPGECSILSVQNCRFSGGSVPFSFTNFSPGRNRSLVVSGNEFDGFTESAVSIQGGVPAFFSGNRFNALQMNSPSTVVQINNQAASVVFSSGFIRNLAGTGISILHSQGSVTIANSMISGFGNSNPTGIRIISSPVSVFGNSVVLSSSNPVLTADSSTIQIKNNILINEGLGAVARFEGVNLDSDFNLFQVYGDPLIQRDDESAASLIDWQEISGSDLHSLSKSVSFSDKENGDLHLAGFSIGDPELKGLFLPGFPIDFDGQERSVENPYIGADEAILALPVELTLFVARVNGKDIELKWETVTETANYGFEIQGSPDETGWIKLGFVPGSGYTTEKKSYHFLLTGKNRLVRFRLIQIDLRGKSTVYPEVSLVGDSRFFELLSAYPNPFNPSTRISVRIPDEGSVSVVFVDVTGKEVDRLNRNFSSGGLKNILWTADHLPSGLYMYRVETKWGKASGKVMLVK
ncbi:MAG: T9SS type A sorting domain-containing protein [Bacteroidetes bacterium]|nr:T9SS type A sorting domain-containing protein [Bacteroidota bacterium]